jgi:kumamolisin
MPELVPLPGSERAELPNVQPTDLDPNAAIEVTIMLRHRAEVPEELITGPETITTQELGQRYGADPADVALVTDVLGRYGLTVTDSRLASRRLKVRGTVAQMSAAFGTMLRQVTSPHPDGSGEVTHRYRSGALSVPAELAEVVTAVLGLDTRPLARPHFRAATARPEAAASPTAVPLTAVQVAELYQFPAGADGTGQTIAVIELGGGYTTSDLNTYFGGLGLSTPSVSAVSVDGAQNSPGQQADMEVELDIEVAGTVAPKASQLVYFTPNTDQGFIDAISDAVHASPAPTVVSISWGQSEDLWSAQSRTAMDSAMADAAALGVTICVAAGDNGSGDGATDGSAHCDFPASSPHALACGGTRLEGSPGSQTIVTEVVWNDAEFGGGGNGATGGGISDVFPLPSWQANAGVRAPAGESGGRGVPDVAGNADPVTGYRIVSGGQQTVVGGTSAVAPLYAGLIARLAERTGKKFGLLQPLVYAGVQPGKGVPAFNDITQGNNGAYSAGPGWDPCTGLGSPNGQTLLKGLSS